MPSTTSAPSVSNGSLQKPHGILTREPAVVCAVPDISALVAGLGIYFLLSRIIFGVCRTIHCKTHFINFSFAHTKMMANLMQNNSNDIVPQSFFWELVFVKDYSSWAVGSKISCYYRVS